MSLRAKGELDLIGYDGDTWAIAGARTRRGHKGQPAFPELGITKEKHEVLVRTAHYFLQDRHIQNCPLRFDVVAIENTPGPPPVVRPHKTAPSSQLPLRFQ
jgi:Holliday junction resolvase-like predicted endonuclease